MKLTIFVGGTKSFAKKTVKFLHSVLLASKPPFLNFNKYWNIRKLTFVSILIAIAVTIAIIGASIIPIASIPTYKFALIGLPVKISGFIFGPVIGFFIGVVSDLISLLFLPSFYHWGYTLANGVNGFIPGVVGLLFYKFIENAIDRKRHIKKINDKISEIKYGATLYIDVPKIALRQIKRLESKKSILQNSRTAQYVYKRNGETLLKNIYLFFGVLAMLAAVGSSVLIIYYGLGEGNLYAEVFAMSFVKNGITLIALTSSGFILAVFFIIAMRFRLPLRKYRILVPIAIFSAFLELTQVYILAYADQNTLGLNFISALVQNILFAPVKIWTNMTIIYYSYRVINYLVNRNKNSRL